MQDIDVLAVGESLGLLSADRAGRLAHARGMRLGFGGAESNVAIGVARLGGFAVWAGRLGGDGVGELIQRELRAEGVAVHAAIDHQAATALMLKERPRPGRSRVTYYRFAQAGSRLRGEDVPTSLIERARIVHVTGITAGLGVGASAAIRSVVDRARAGGALVSLDVNHRSALWRDERDAIAAYRDLASRADIVFAGEDEATLLTGERAISDQVRRLREWGVDSIVIKRGEAGAIAVDGGREVRSEAILVDVVDTVGAGDAFVAGWLAETARGADIEARLETAIACGALACTSDGDWEAAPTRADLEDFMRHGDPVQR